MTSSLDAVLDRARSVGFLGPGPIRAHIEHADRYIDALPLDAKRMVDLGAGGGIPGLAILLARPNLNAVLLDAAARRGAFLTWATVELGIADRVQVAVGRAEELAYEPGYRASFDVMVARGFGPPASTLENARGYLSPSGIAVISEPPGGRHWPVDALERLAFEEVEAPSEVAIFRALGEPPADIPRKHKQQKRAPLF